MADKREPNSLPYPLVWAYYRHVTKSGSSFARFRVIQAQHQHAPEDAVHLWNDRWITADEIYNPETREILGLPPLPLRGVSGRSTGSSEQGSLDRQPGGPCRADEPRQSASTLNDQPGTHDEHGP
jgi:hypothetical protein